MSALDRLRGVRLKNPGFIFDENSGYRVAEDGRLVKEGSIFDEPTAFRIAEDGRIMKDGVLFEESTGYRIDVEGEVIKLGSLMDTRTGLRVGSDGSLNKREWAGESRLAWPNAEVESIEVGDSIPLVASDGEHTSSDTAAGDISLDRRPWARWEIEKQKAFAQKFLRTVQTGEKFTVRQFRETLREPWVFEERHHLVWSALHFGSTYIGPSLDQRQANELRAAVIDQYEEWSKRIGAQYALDTASACNRWPPFEFPLPIVGAAFLLFVAKSGWLTSLIYAACLGLPLSWSVRRVRCLFGVNYRRYEREALFEFLNISKGKARVLVPDDLSWLWNIFARSSIQESKLLSKQITGFREIVESKKRQGSV